MPPEAHCWSMSPDNLIDGCWQHCYCRSYQAESVICLAEHPPHLGFNLLPPHNAATLGHQQCCKLQQQQCSWADTAEKTHCTGYPGTTADATCMTGLYHDGVYADCRVLTRGVPGSASTAGNAILSACLFGYLHTVAAGVLLLRAPKLEMSQL